MKKLHTFEEDILLLQRESKYVSISIEEILNLLSEKGIALVLILLSIPFCQPIQIPGFSTPFGLLIAFLSVRMILGKSIWLPKKLLSIEVPTKIIQNITEKALIFIKKIRRFIHPRVLWISQNPLMRIMNSISLFCLGIFLALPLPIPFTNLISAWSILLMALGIIEDDGLFIIFGYMVFLMAISLFIAIGISLTYIF